MEVKAIFTGAEGSSGYENGRQYTLKLKMLKDHVGKKHFYISLLDDTQMCYYESPIAFLNNWDNIRKV